MLDRLKKNFRDHPMSSYLAVAVLGYIAYKGFIEKRPASVAPALQGSDHGVEKAIEDFTDAYASAHGY